MCRTIFFFLGPANIHFDYGRSKPLKSLTNFGHIKWIMKWFGRFLNSQILSIIQPYSERLRLPQTGWAILRRLRLIRVRRRRLDNKFGNLRIFEIISESIILVSRPCLTQNLLNLYQIMFPERHKWRSVILKKWMPMIWLKWWHINLSGNASICFSFIIYKLPWKGICICHLSKRLEDVKTLCMG